uniref:Drebrin-like protein n=1 Tax=Phallusia mammillata TaxID=59560 RepID=A0A6F9D9U8_9ASCI|nr:drebrin-like protein [Phallusia mammillata]
MSVSFFAHKQALLDAYNDVINDKTDTDWALFTYEGNKNELKVQGTGDEGLDELESEFNSGKIMYAFVRVKDPNTTMKKFLIIVWQGDGVPATRKGACANHVKDITRFFKGSHIVIYARNDDDVTPEEIMHQVQKSTSNFTYVAPKETEDIPTAVGSVYKRINPEQEIKSTRNDKFWTQIQKEEEQRKAEDKKRAMEKKREESLALKERERKSEEERNRLVKQREKEIAEKLRAQKLADDESERLTKEKSQWEKQEKEQEASLQEQRRVRRSQSIEHAQEAESMISQRSSNPRNIWAQREKDANAAPPPVRKYSSSGSRTSSISEQPEPKQEYNAPASNYQPEPAYEPEPAYQPEPAHQPEPAYQPEPTYQPEPSYQQPPYEPEPAAPEPTNESYYEQTEPQYQEENAYEAEPQYEPEAAQQSEPNYQQDDQYNAYSEATTQGVSARALYDYQADEEGELTFDPGDIINEIEQIDEGWWRGVLEKDGSYGLFPANYVETL